MSKKKVVFVAFAVKDDGTTKDEAFPKLMFEVMRFELTTFIFWKKALLVVMAFAAQMLLPGPFRKILEVFTANTPFASIEAFPLYVFNNTYPAILLEPRIKTVPDFATEHSNPLKYIE